MKSAGRRSRSRVKRLTQSFFPATGRRRCPGTDRKNPGGARAWEAVPSPSDRDRGLPGPPGPRVTRVEGTNGANGSPLRTAGRAYVYLIYGLHAMLNVVAGATGQGQGSADPSGRSARRLEGGFSRGPAGSHRPADYPTAKRPRCDRSATSLPGQSRRSTGRAIDKTDGITTRSSGRTHPFASSTQIGRTGKPRSRAANQPQKDWAHVGDRLNSWPGPSRPLEMLPRDAR